jgi:hypothetical protein
MDGDVQPIDENMDMFQFVNDAFATIGQTMEHIDQEHDQVALKAKQLEDDEVFNGG